ncbi:MAG: tetratricopeptide repeat protein [Elusimicrobiota bacterium]
MRTCTATLLAGLLLAAAPAGAQKIPADEKRPSMESLFLDFSKTHLGPIGKEDAKRKYLYTIQLEKSRLSHSLLRTIYSNAYDLYRQGDYDGARELTAKILQMDPSFQDAAILHRAAAELRGSSKPMVSGRKLVESRFEEGLSLYRQGRLVEASKRWEEAVKLAPGNLKARYWLKKVRRELADEHFRRGQRAYRQHRLRDALDQWYAALILNPRYPRLMDVISKAESEIRRQQANEKLQRALQLYGQGNTTESLKVLDEVLEIAPGEKKAEKLISEIRLEIGTQHVAQGRGLYRQRKYTGAIAEWNKAVEYGYDPRRANVLIARARDQMRREREEAQRRAEDDERRRREAEQRAREDEEARRLAELEKQKQLDAKPPEVEPEPSDEENRRRALKHWNNGIIFFQKGDYPKARDEWLLCKQFDAKNTDCQAGLQRIDNTYGGGP